MIQGTCHLLRVHSATQQQMSLRDVIRREVCRVGFDQRNPKPETRNPKPTVKFLKLVSNCGTRNPKPETRNRLWRLTFPRTAIETRNPKPTLKTYFPQDRSKPETRNPKPKTDSEDLYNGPIETRNPKPETDSESWFQATKPYETRNPKPTAKVGFNRRHPKPETRNPKPETRNRLESDFWVALRIGTRLWLACVRWG